MRVALVADGIAPHLRGGIADHTAALARALARAGMEVEVFVPRALAGHNPLAQRREERFPGDDGYAVTWVNASPAELAAPDGERRVAETFGSFLDRERPQIVHFEHLAGFGPDGVHEARRRGLPTVYVAHDWWAVHDNRRLVLPDLTTFEPGDLEAEARGRLALRWLEGPQGPPRGRALARVGAALRSELDDATWARLHSFLHPSRSHARGGRVESRALEAVLDEVRARNAAKRAALSLVDARFASSRALARRLSALVGRAFTFRAPGAPREELLAAPRAPRAEGAPLRVGFVGAVEKVGGLHVLLAACAGLEDVLELHIHGSGDDRAYAAACRERAGQLGAVWHGEVRDGELPAVLAGLDVLVAPTLWSESSPIALRAAFALGLTVVASDGDGQRECVEPPVADDVRGGEGLVGPKLGLLVRRGDVESLRQGLVRVAEDHALRAEYALAAQRLDGPLTKRLGQEAGEWVATYAQLAGAVQRRRVAPDVPAHLAPFARRMAALEALPTRELFREVTDGLVRLGASVGLDLSATELMTLAVGRGSEVRDERAADARAIEWLRTSLRELGEARSALEAGTRWRDERLRALGSELAAFERAVQERERELAGLRAERAELGAARGALEGERERLQAAVSERERQQRELEARLADARAALQSLVEERNWLRDTLDRGTEELRQLREHVAADVEGALTDREALELHFERLRSEHEALRRHEEWLRSELGSLVGDLVGAPLSEGSELERNVAEGRTRLDRLVAELTWRRREMEAARDAAAGLFARFAGGELALRARTWAAPPSAAFDEVDLDFDLPAAPAGAKSVEVVMQPAPRGAVPTPPDTAARAARAEERP